MKFYFYLSLIIFGICHLMIYNSVKAQNVQESSRPSFTIDPHDIQGGLGSPPRPSFTIDPHNIQGGLGSPPPPPDPEGYLGGGLNLSAIITLESIQRRSNGNIKLNFAIESNKCNSTDSHPQSHRRVRGSRRLYNSSPTRSPMPMSENHCISRYSFIDDDGIASLVTVQYILKHKYQGRPLQATVPSEEKPTLDFIQENLERVRKHYDDLVHEHQDHPDLKEFYENKRNHASNILSRFSRQPLRFQQLHDLGNFLEDVSPDHEYQVRDENDRFINVTSIGGGGLFGTLAGTSLAGTEIPLHHSSSNGLGLLPVNPKRLTMRPKQTRVKGEDLNQLIHQSRPLQSKPLSIPQNIRGHR